MPQDAIEAASAFSLSVEAGHTLIQLPADTPSYSALVLSLCGLQVEACTVKMAHFKNCEVIEGLIRDDVLVQLPHPSPIRSGHDLNAVWV